MTPERAVGQGRNLRTFKAPDCPTKGQTAYGAQHGGM
jgi:hypothetical protein